MASNPSATPASFINVPAAKVCFYPLAPDNASCWATSMHHFVALPLGKEGSAPVNPEHGAAIKRWTRDYLQLSDDAVISLHEFSCSDPGCPLLETVIVVFENERTRRWKLTRPRSAVTKTMVQQTLASVPF